MSTHKGRATEILYSRANRRLDIVFDNSNRYSFTAEFLRVESPSAEVRGHGAGTKQAVPGRRHVGIVKIEPVGNYAVRLHFDDGHDSGIYSWAYLQELGETEDELWGAYLKALAAAGLSRDP